MAAINNSNNSGAGGSNVYRVGDYVYFETQQQQQPVHQQQPFQIRRIEELNKTAGGNVEAKVMCFYRRRDLPAQLIALADKHQQHQQQLSLTLSLSPGGRSSNKLTSKTNEKDTMVDSKEQYPSATQKKKGVDEDQTVNHTETLQTTGIVKEESHQEEVELAEKVENNVSASVVKRGDGNDSSIETLDTGKDKDKTVHTALQQQNNWWRSEQLKQRELFLSRQVETLAATHIRGKCTVTLYNETESLDGYLEKDDTFFYCLVFDPVQKTLLADKGEIRVGHKYQAEVPSKAQLSRNDLKTKDIKSEIVKKECLIDGEGIEIITKSIQDEANKVCATNAPTTVTTIASIGTNMTLESDSNIETLVWTCMPQWNRLTDRQIDQFLVVSRSLGTFARALDCTSSVKQPSLHMSAAAASRDITLALKKSNSTNMLSKFLVIFVSNSRVIFKIRFGDVTTHYTVYTRLYHCLTESLIDF